MLISTGWQPAATHRPRRMKVAASRRVLLAAFGGSGSEDPRTQPTGSAGAPSVYSHPAVGGSGAQANSSKRFCSFFIRLPEMPPSASMARRMRARTRSGPRISIDWNSGSEAVSPDMAT